MYIPKTTNTYDSTWKSTGRALVDCNWAAVCRKAKEISQNGYKFKHFRKVCFDVWYLKLEILTCFDKVL